MVAEIAGRSLTHPLHSSQSNPLLYTTSRNHFESKMWQAITVSQLVLASFSFCSSSPRALQAIAADFHSMATPRFSPSSQRSEQPPPVSAEMSPGERLVPLLPRKEVSGTPPPHVGRS